MFNMVDYLDSLGAKPFNESNMTMDCPKCHKGRGHFVISVDPSKPVFNCYRCGFKGSWGKLLVTLKGINYEEAAEILQESHWFKKKQTEQEDLRPIPLPNMAPFSQDALDYLRRRDITSADIDYYGMYFCAEGKYRDRIIIPIYHNYRQITFQARAIYKHPIKYHTPPGSPLGRLLFNYDSIPQKAQKVVVVEGVFDTIRLVRLGWNTVASFGKKISQDQISLLRQKGVSEVVVYWDADASKEIKNAFIELQKYFKASMALLEDGDPDTYSNPSLPIKYAIDNLEDFYYFQMQSFSSKIINA